MSKEKDKKNNNKKIIKLGKVFRNVGQQTTNSLHIRGHENTVIATLQNNFYRFFFFFFGEERRGNESNKMMNKKHLLNNIPTS